MSKIIQCPYCEWISQKGTPRSINMHIMMKHPKNQSIIGMGKGDKKEKKLKKEAKKVMDMPPPQFDTTTEPIEPILSKTRIEELRKQMYKQAEEKDKEQARVKKLESDIKTALDRLDITKGEHQRTTKLAKQLLENKGMSAEEILDLIIPERTEKEQKAVPAGEPEEDEDEPMSTASYKLRDKIDGSIVLRKDRTLKNDYESLKKQIAKGNQAVRIDVTNTNPMTLITTVLNSDLSERDKTEFVDNIKAFSIDTKKIEELAKARTSSIANPIERKAEYKKIINEETDKEIEKIKNKVKDLGKKLIKKTFNPSVKSKSQLIKELSNIQV